jgi:protein-histidine pros-kinase
VKLLTKFNLILLAAFGLSVAVVATIAYYFLVSSARQQVMDQAELMMASATSVRSYTASDLTPLLEKNPDHAKRFLPESVPFFAATTIFDDLRKTYPDYTYKEATLNPTNLADRATDWEADVIRDLRDHPALRQISGEREGATGREIYLALPIKVTAECLQCHSTPAAAPPAMLARYGSSNGFGWQPGEIVGAQMVSLPLSVPLELAKAAWGRLVLYLVLALVLTVAVLDAAAYAFVIRPLRLVAAAADRASTGDPNAPELEVKGEDEIAVVTAAFNRMRVSLAKALRMLDG